MNTTLEALAFGLGTTELLIVFGIFIFIFGASRIPELGKSLGSGIRGFQKAIKGQDEPNQLEVDAEAESETDNTSEESA